MADQIISLQSVNYPTHYIRHRDFLGWITTISSQLDKEDSTFKIVPSLDMPNNPRAISFESVNYPGYYLRHQDFRIKLMEPDGSELFRQDATFLLEPGNADPSNQNVVSFRSINYPTHFIRHQNFMLYIQEGSGDLFDKDTTFMPVVANA